MKQAKSNLNLKEFNEHIKRAGVLTSLFESLYAVGIESQRSLSIWAICHDTSIV